MKRWGVAVGLMLWLLWFGGATALARPGGGHSFSSGSHASSSSHASSGSHSSGGSYSSSGSHSSGSSPSSSGGGQYTGGGGQYTGGGGQYSGGGGQYTGGGAPYSGSGSTDAGTAAVTLIMLAVFVCILVTVWKRKAAAEWSTRAAWAPPPPPEPRPDARRQLAALRGSDPDFSLVLFEDFVYGLFADAHSARGRGELARLSPYIAARAQAQLAGLGSVPLVDVRGVVIGAMSYESVTDTSAETVVVVRFDANYDERTSSTASRSLYVVEDWELRRRGGVVSKPPSPTRVLGCPNCAAALTQVEHGVCSHCGQNVGNGAFDWQVSDVASVRRELKAPELGGGYAEEQGTDQPTLVATDLAPRLAELQQRDPAFAMPQLEARVGLIFAEMQAGWSARDWTRVRPFLSDCLFQTQLYWITEYERARLRNMTENARITRIDVARVDSDRWFDAVTLRVFATSLDYTVSDAGQLVGGSRSRPRAYTEYWTVIRGSARTGAAAAAKQCPNCGAALKINMAGSCEYCQAKVTSGAFDWVLSRIEQDDVYAG